MIIENDFVSRWHKVKIMKCIQYGKKNEKSLQKFCGDFLYPFNLNMLYLFQLFFIFRICMAFHLYFQIVQNLSATFFIQYIKLSKELVK